MDHPENETMEVLVIVAFPELKTSTSEKAWEEDIIDAVSAAVCVDKTLDTVAVRQLKYEDCQWVFEGGMPMPDYGVTIGQDGSWHSSVELYRAEYEASGQDLQSLAVAAVFSSAWRKARAPRSIEEWHKADPEGLEGFVELAKRGAA